MKNKHIFYNELDVTENSLTMEECTEEILELAVKMNDDSTSTMVNASRVKSLEGLLTLYTQYNDHLIEKSLEHEKIGTTDSP
jgi:hypothetical protein